MGTEESSCVREGDAGTACSALRSLVPPSVHEAFHTTGDLLSAAPALHALLPPVELKLYTVPAFITRTIVAINLLSVRSSSSSSVLRSQYSRRCEQDWSRNERENELTCAPYAIVHSGILGIPSGPSSIPAIVHVSHFFHPHASSLTLWHIPHDLSRRSSALVHLSRVVSLARPKERHERTLPTNSTTSNPRSFRTCSSAGLYGPGPSAPGSSNLATMAATIVCCCVKRTRSAGGREGPLVVR